MTTNRQRRLGLQALSRGALTLAGARGLPWLGRTLALSAAAAGTGAAFAQSDNYPGKPIRIVVGFAPGGATDGIARLIAQQLNEAWGQPAVVENRPGAGGNIGHEQVARAAGDGYTLLFTSAPLAINPSLYPSLGYDSLRDFKPITLVATVPSVLVVPASSPMRTFADFLARARARPGGLTYGSAGNGTPQHLAMELLKSMAKIHLVHIPYKGGAPAIADLIGGQTDAMFAATPEAAPHLASGRLRALAISSPTRAATLPDVPTVAEAGVPGFEAIGWQGFLAPGSTPPALVEKLHQATLAGLAKPDVRKRIDAMGIQYDGRGPAPFSAFLAQEVPKWARVVKSSGARLD